MSEQEHIHIAPDGTVRFVWTDELAALLEEGRASIVRVGDVEPAPGGPGGVGGWMADLSRIGGGTYGPYPLRSLALFHERAIVEGRLIAGLLNHLGAST